MATRSRVTEGEVPELPLGAPDGDPLHHALELAEVDLAVVVAVDVADHLLHGGQVPRLGQAEFLEHGLKLGGGDEAVAVLVEDAERLLHVRLVVRLLALLHLGVGAEQRVAERAVEGLEVVEAEPRGAGRDVPADGGLEARAVGAEAERVERRGHLVEGDLAVAVAVEEVEDAAQAQRVQAAVAEAERRRGLLGQRRLCRSGGESGGLHGAIELAVSSPALGSCVGGSALGLTISGARMLSLLAVWVTVY
jgi:hypothetical protein